MTANVGPGPRPIGEDELQAYVDGLLDAGRRGEVEAYLAAHPEEVERVEAYHLQNIGFHALFDRPSAEELAVPAPIDRLRRDLQAAVACRRLWCRAAASLTLVLGLGAISWCGSGFDASPSERGPTLAPQSIAADDLHRRRDPPQVADAALGVPQAASLVDWLSQRVVGEQSVWPDLRSFGLALTGEHMAVAAAKGLAVMLVYEDAAGHRLALHIDLNGRDLPIGPPAIQEEEAALYWRSGPLVLGIVGIMEHRELLQIAEAVTEQIVSAGPDRRAPEGDRLLPAQSEPPAAHAVTQAAAAGPPAGATDVAQGAGGEVVAEPVPEEAGAVGPPAAPSPSPAGEPLPAEGGEGQQAEPEEGKPISGLPPVRLQSALADRVGVAPGGVEAVARA